MLGSLLALGMVGCAGGPSELPDPRPIVIRSGARLFPEKPRLEEIDSWFRPQMENIEMDPTFMIETVVRDTPSYPWESLLIVEPDTARIGVEGGKSIEAETAYQIYAHLRLMEFMGRLDEFLPGSANLQGFTLERAILSRVADVWLYGRAVFDAEAYDPLEELVYSSENGYLDAFILTARGEEFGQERQAWLREDPEALERYRQWFVDTFSREPPGLRETG
ncbi:hypothetical protein ACFL3S_02620 [Gemmatimonadota bacterium]